VSAVVPDGMFFDTWAGPDVGALDDPTSETAILTMPAAPAAITATFAAPNQAPVADAGTDQVVDEGSTAMLDGAASYDPDSGPAPLEYLWTQTDGPEVVLSDTTAVQPTFMAPPVPTVTILTFELTVSDGDLVDTATVHVTVNESNFEPLLDVISTPQTAPEHFVFEIDLEATDADVPPQTLSYGMTGAPVNATLDTATGLFSFRPDESQGGQSYIVTFTVDDGAEGSDSQDVQIDVTESDTGEGDVDKDGDVDAVDIAIIAFYFGLEAGAYPDADLDQSGFIDGGDFAEVIANWGNHYNN
jgi:hypothetical protein